MARFVPVDTTFGQTSSPRFVPVGRPGDAGAAPADDSAAFGAAGAIARAAGRGIGLVNRFMDTGSPMLREAGAGFGTIGGLADIARAATAPSGTASQRAANAARGAIGATRALASSSTVGAALPAATSAANTALNSGVSIGTNAAGGAASVPYVGGALALWDIANIADSDMDDGRKAYESAHQVGRVVADAFLPGVGGMLADLAKTGRDALFMNDFLFNEDYAKKRKQESGNMPRAAAVMLQRIQEAATPEELQEAVADPTFFGKTAPRLNNGRVLVTGTHLEGLGGLEEQLTDAYQRQLALFQDPAAAPRLAELRARSAQRTADMSLIASYNKADPVLADPKIMRSLLIGNPETVDDRVFELYDGALSANARYARENRAAGTNAGEVDRQAGQATALREALTRLGIDVDGAAERKRQRDAEQATFQQSMNSVGGL